MGETPAKSINLFYDKAKEGKKLKVRVIAGSEGDYVEVNWFLAIIKMLGIDYELSIASCHGHMMNGFEEFIGGIEEDIIVMIGGMSLAAPGIIRAILKGLGVVGRIVFGIPTDKAALSAIQDIPSGTPVIMCGFNKKSPKASVENSALAVAEMVVMKSGDQEIAGKLKEWYKNRLRLKPLKRKVELDENGLMPAPKK